MLKKLSKKVEHSAKLAGMQGIPFIWIRDPKTGIGSVSLTLVVVSSILVIIGCVGKWSGKLGTVDFHEALELFFASTALYFGRNWKTGTSTKDPAVENQDTTPNTDESSTPPLKDN